MKDDLKHVNEKLDIDRTDEIFDSVISRSKVNDKSKDVDELEMKKINLVVKSGNLHVNTAKAKMGIMRLLGYQESKGAIKNAVDRKVRNMRKYGN